jgi:glycosyltransferase involved in cell wall biosynthesis
LIHELIFVCDEPVDNSEQLLLDLCKHHDWLQVISLARNSGQHLATAVGILYSSGDWVLTIDEDLQHPPEMLPQLLIYALENRSDLVYVRSFTRVHSSSLYRDFTSWASKLCMKIFTRDDYTSISSFRLIRGEIARTVASSIDPKSYLDASLFSVTSVKRRAVFQSSFQDQRGNRNSGYSLKKLVRHYVRLIMSAELSGFRLFGFLAFIIVSPLVAMMFMLLFSGWISGIREVAPGWLSLFFLGVLMNMFLLVYSVYSLKLLSVLFARSTGCPSFMVINRELDFAHLSFLRGLV